MQAARYLPYLSSRIHYYTWGTGPGMIFAFHGYGESAGSFAFLGAAIDAGCTLVAIDLPFHGLTEWNEGAGLQPAQLLEMMELIATTSVAEASAKATSEASVKATPEALPKATPTPWTLLGYSMGGRIALSLLQDYPNHFSRIILAAPDGMVVNPWYWIATATSPGNHLFRWSMKHPTLLFWLLRFFHAIGFLNRSIYKFAVHYIDDKKVRRELYIRWTAMRRFKPRLPVVAAIVRNHKVPVTLLYGKFDRIIRWERGEKFRRLTGDNCRLLLLDAGHQLLRDQFLPIYLPLISALCP